MGRWLRSDLGAHGSAGVLLAMAMLVGCPSPPPHVVLQVEDPDQLAFDAVALEFGDTAQDMNRIELDGTAFPVTFTITAEQEGPSDLWVHAKDLVGETIAVGFAQVTLAREKGRVHRVKLTPSCSVATEGAACLTSAGALNGQCSAQRCRGAVWEKVEDGGEGLDDDATDVAFDPAGNLFVVGNLNRAGLSLDSGALWVAKYSRSGELLWSRTGVEGAVTSFANSVSADRDGDVFVAGLIRKDQARDDAVAWIGKFSSEGTLLWAQEHDAGTDFSDFGQATATDSRGDLIVGGGLGEENPFQPENLGAPWLAKYDGSSGEELWSRAHAETDLPGSNLSVVCDRQDNIYAVGWEKQLDGDTDAFIAKHTPDGEEIWREMYSTAGGEMDSASGVDVDSSGRVNVAGTENWGVSANSDIWVHQYREDGTRIWSSGFDGPARSRDRAIDLATDDDDNIVVVGWISLGGVDSDAWVRKYDAAGAPQWTLTFDGGERLYDFFEAVAIDEDGSIAACGATKSFRAGLDLLVLRFEP